MEPIDLDSYRLGPQAGREEPRTPLSWATFALDRANALGPFVPFLQPRNVYANPRGGANLRFRPASDLAAGGAVQTDDTFLLDIQFVNVRFKNPSATGDPVEAYGPTFSLFDFMDML